MKKKEKCYMKQRDSKLRYTTKSAINVNKNKIMGNDLQCTDLYKYAVHQYRKPCEKKNNILRVNIPIKKNILLPDTRPIQDRKLLRSIHHPTNLSISKSYAYKNNLHKNYMRNKSLNQLLSYDSVRSPMDVRNTKNKVLGLKSNKSVKARMCLKFKRHLRKYLAKLRRSIVTQSNECDKSKRNECPLFCKNMGIRSTKLASWAKHKIPGEEHNVSLKNNKNIYPKPSEENIKLENLLFPMHKSQHTIRDLPNKVKLMENITNNVVPSTTSIDINAKLFSEHILGGSLECPGSKEHSNIYTNRENNLSDKHANKGMYLLHDSEVIDTETHMKCLLYSYENSRMIQRESPNKTICGYSLKNQNQLNFNRNNGTICSLMLRDYFSGQRSKRSSKNVIPEIHQVDSSCITVTVLDTEGYKLEDDVNVMYNLEHQSCTDRPDEVNFSSSFFKDPEVDITNNDSNTNNLNSETSSNNYKCNENKKYETVKIKTHNPKRIVKKTTTDIKTGEEKVKKKVNIETEESKLCLHYRHNHKLCRRCLRYLPNRSANTKNRRCPCSKKPSITKIDQETMTEDSGVESSCQSQTVTIRPANREKCTQWKNFSRKLSVTKLHQETMTENSSVQSSSQNQNLANRPANKEKNNQESMTEDSSNYLTDKTQNSSVDVSPLPYNIQKNKSRASHIENASHNAGPKVPIVSNIYKKDNDMSEESSEEPTGIITNRMKNIKYINPFLYKPKGCTCKQCSRQSLLRSATKTNIHKRQENKVSYSPELQIYSSDTKTDHDSTSRVSSDQSASRKYKKKLKYNGRVQCKQSIPIKLYPNYCDERHCNCMKMYSLTHKVKATSNSENQKKRVIYSTKRQRDKKKNKFKQDSISEGSSKIFENVVITNQYPESQTNKQKNKGYHGRHASTDLPETLYKKRKKYKKFFKSLDYNHDKMYPVFHNPNLNQRRCCFNPRLKNNSSIDSTFGKIQKKKVTYTAEAQTYSPKNKKYQKCDLFCNELPIVIKECHKVKGQDSENIPKKYRKHKKRTDSFAYIEADIPVHVCTSKEILDVGNYGDTCKTQNECLDRRYNIGDSINELANLTKQFYKNLESFDHSLKCEKGKVYLCPCHPYYVGDFKCSCSPKYVNNNRKQYNKVIYRQKSKIYSNNKTTHRPNKASNKNIEYSLCHNQANELGPVRSNCGDVIQCLSGTHNYDIYDMLPNNSNNTTYEKKIVTTSEQNSLNNGNETYENVDDLVRHQLERYNILQNEIKDKIEQLRKKKIIKPGFQITKKGALEPKKTGIDFKKVGKKEVSNIKDDLQEREQDPISIFNVGSSKDKKSLKLRLRKFFKTIFIRHGNQKVKFA